MIHQKNYDFSFSGLKTAVLYYLRDYKNIRTSDVLNIDGSNFGTSDVQKLKSNIAASFQQAIIDVLIAKTFRAAREFEAQSILLSGGVANNKALRQNFRKEARKKKINFFAPSLEFTTDNAAMTAVAAYFNYLKNKKLKLIAQANLKI
jgi:N6-L-threonylcarbamoyladenine synthase